MKKIIFLISIVIFSNNAFGYTFKLNEISKFKNPWGSSFINDQKLLITEKSGSIKLINLTSNEIINIDHNLNILEDGQGGLLDILFYQNNQL